MNLLVISGRVLRNSDNAPHNYMFSQGDENKKSFLRMTLSTQKPGRQKDENGYYKTFFWSVKAFGPTAELINQYVGQGAKIVVSGELDMSEEYTSPEGKVYPPRAEMIANSVWLDVSGNGKDSGNATATASVAQKQTNARPATATTAVRPMGQQRKTPF